MAMPARCAAVALHRPPRLTRHRHRHVASSAGDGSSSNTATQDSASQQQQQKFESKRYQVAQGMRLAILGASVGVPLRFGSGAAIQGYKLSFLPQEEVPANQYVSYEFAGRKVIETGNVGPRPQQPIELYEFEGCPFCRKVREVTTILDLDVLFYPCPANGPTYRPKAMELGGKRQFPYMIDPNTGVSMYESDDIIKYLVQRYGNGNVPLPLSLGPLTNLTAGLTMLGRPGKGSKYVPARKPDKILELWAYEASPFCKIVRETLVELELPHIYHSCARGSRRRNELVEKTGIFQVPYLEDPNTGTCMFESSEIVEYLRRTYALS